MYLRFDSRRAPANDVKLGSMTDRSLNAAAPLLSGLWLALTLATTTPAAQAAANGLIGSIAPDFALPAFVGSNVRLSEYRGQPVVVSFWSSRCSTCARHLAALERLYNTYRSSGLIVMAISVDDDPQRAEQYARGHMTSYPLLLDSAKSVSREFAIDRLPATVLIDRSGIVRFLHNDDRAEDGSYVTQIRALLDDNLAAP
jgi:peroxiredoxin